MPRLYINRLPLTLQLKVEENDSHTTCRLRISPEFRLCLVLEALVSWSKSPLTCCSVEFERASHVMFTVCPEKLVLKTTFNDWTLCSLGNVVAGRACGEVLQPVASHQQTETAAVATAVSGLDSFYGNPPTG